VDGAGAEASRLLWRKLSPFTGAMGLPADASGAYRPNPQATTKLAPRPSSLKDYLFPTIQIDYFGKIFIYCKKVLKDRQTILHNPGDTREP